MVLEGTGIHLYMSLNIKVTQTLLGEDIPRSREKTPKSSLVHSKRLHVNMFFFGNNRFRSHAMVMWGRPVGYSSLRPSSSN